MNLKGKDFLALKDFTGEEIRKIVELGMKLKKEKKDGIEHHILKGKTLGMIFQKSSTRTRISFEAGMYQLGGQAIFLNPNDLQIGRGEPLKDTARVLARYVDGILIRTFSHKEVENLAFYSDVPVINGLTDDFHPTQVIADLITIKENFGKIESLNLSYVGDGNNMAHSLMIGGALTGMNVTIASPEGYQPKIEIVELAKSLADYSGANINVLENPEEALIDADIVYTDTWASMGQEAEKEVRIKAFNGYQIDDYKMSIAKKEAIFLHCLPAYRGYEVTDSVMEGKQSRVFDEAENRLHAHKAILASVL